MSGAEIRAGVAAPAQPPASTPTAGASRLWAGLGAATLAVAGALAVLYAWGVGPFDSPVIETENALVRGQVTVIGSQIAGYVDEVLVQDFQAVKAGQVLVRIDSRALRQRVAQARAQLEAQEAALANWPQQQRSARAGVALAEAALASARAQADRAAADLRRADRLSGEGSLSLRERDQSRAAGLQSAASVEQAGASLEIARQNAAAVQVNRAVLQAAVDGARATLAAADVDLSNTVIGAPVAGELGQVGVRRGAYVNAGAQLMALVPARMWVIANFKETQMNRVRVGQPASFHIDALDGARLRGHVERLAPATGSEFSVLPADNATGNYVKIAQRMAVRIAIDPGQALAARLRPGMSVVVRVDTAERR